MNPTTSEQNTLSRLAIFQEDSASGLPNQLSRRLKFGGIPVVSGSVGGFSRQVIEKELHLEGIQTDFILADFESRTCTSILDSEKQTMKESPVVWRLGLQIQ
jgi:fructose-1-phosphate kinase PfkB-like protein